MKLTKKKRLLLLAGWTAFLALVYFGLGNTKWTMPITYSYFALCLVFSILYVLINGGITPIMEKDREKEKKSREQYLADKGKAHPIKKRDKYRRFRIKKEEETVEEKPSVPRPNPLGLPEEKRELLGQILLIVTVPFYLIFLIDWIVLYFF